MEVCPSYDIANFNITHNNMYLKINKQSYVETQKLI